MGSATSRFAETDWDNVNGGLTTAEETLDKTTPPTQHHTILTLQKYSSLVNQRAFEIRDLDDDDVSKILFKSQPIEGTSKWFDLCNANGEKIFCIQTTDSNHDHWQIYRYNKPNWEGQECEDDPNAKEHLLKVAEEGESVSLLLYRTARMDISRNKNQGNVYKYVKDPNNEDMKGVLSTTDSLLQVENIASITGQYQSFVPAPASEQRGSSAAASAVSALLHHSPPLVGFWVWEHTPHRHQMKMHLAKGADIVLHCIAAIMTNMVHVEKKTDDEERIR